MTPRDGVSDSLYFWRYNEPLTPSRGVKKNRPLPLATTLQKPKGLFDVNYSINSLNGGVNEFCQKIHSC